MTVHWTHNAINQLLAIYEYLAQSSPTYAQRTVDKVTRCSKQLSAFPHSGRVVPEYERGDIRELIESPYRVIYRIKPAQIDILAVVHTAQHLSGDLAGNGS